MKKLCIYFIIFLIVSCNKIESPLPEEFGKFDWSLYPGDPITYSSSFYDISNPDGNWTLNTNPKGILLEYYTGHICQQCPVAGSEAKRLDTTFSNVIMTSIHAHPQGAFQGPEPPTFTIDYQTEAGNEYVRESGEMPGMFANPLGTINRRINSLSTEHWFQKDKWENAINDEILDSILNINIQSQSHIFTQTNGLYIHNQSSILNNISGNYHLVIYLVRDICVSPQKTQNGTILDYEHLYVLSDNINGTWGTEIVNGTAEKDSIIYNNFTYQLIDPNMDSTYNPYNLSLITYVIDRNDMKILQVIKTKPNIH
tara:strand:- start:436 stop:1371 length:936 start_codon:yes stop_codon:yes gene_type:complete